MDIESKRTYGWYVRVHFRGKANTKFFADKKCGGKDLSLKAAIAWRNITEAHVGKPRSERPVVSVSNNASTNVVGVRLDNVLNHYEVSWVKPDGNPGKTSISINKYGKKAAFAKACKIRKKKDAERLATEKPVLE